MLEADVYIDDELASNGFKRAMRWRALRDITYFYAENLMIVWIVVAIADAIFDAEELITRHLLFLIGLGIIASAWRYYSWNKEVAKTKGWCFRATLDENGVVTALVRNAEVRTSWDSYKGYVEYDTYLQIEHHDGNFSFLPKTSELLEVIEFTKRKLPQNK